MTAMNLLMTDRAVLKARRPQVVEGGRDYSGRRFRAHYGRQVGVAFEADLLNGGTRQHPRIRRAVRLMTRCTTLETHWRMFKSEWATLVAMAPEAAWLVGGEA